MQRLMRRPSSCGDAEVAGRPRVDLHLVEVVMPRRRIAACQSGCSLHADDGDSDSPNSSAGRMPSSTVHDRISRAVTDTTTSIASSRPGGTSRASTSTVDRRAGTVREHDRLVGLAQAHVREHEVGLVAVVGRDQRDRGRISSAVIGSSGWSSLTATRRACWRMYSAVPDDEALRRCSPSR